MRECLVGFGHTVNFITLFHRGTATFSGVQQFTGQAEAHRLLATLARRILDPTHRQSGAANRTNFNRNLVVGATNPESAAPGTIRGSFGRICSRHGYFENVVHASGNAEEAEREVGIWFRPEELVAL